MILIRLINGDKVVGFEKHEYDKIRKTMRIYHKKIHNPASAFKDDSAWDSVTGDYNPFYIKHSRKDLFTGIEIDGEKVFENDLRDYGKYTGNLPEGFNANCITKIVYDKDHACFGEVHLNHPYGDDSHRSGIDPSSKPAGIQGVTP